MNIAKLLMVSFVALLASSCSSYRGHKVASDGTLPAGENTGLPFQMTRPEYTLNVAPSAADATVATYTLIATHVPDPDNRYTLALDPAIFADSTFLMKFGRFGNISQNTSGTTSRVAATITAVAGAAADVIGALRDQSTAYDQWLSAITKSTSAECKAKMSEISVGDFIKADVSELENVGHPATKDAGINQVLQLYHPATIAEKSCLQKVRREIADKNDGDLKKIKETYTDALKLIGTNPHKEKIADLVNNDDIKELTAFQAVLTSSIGNDPLAAEALGVSQKGAAFLMKSQSNETQDLAGTFADMSPTVWRARHLLYLERRISEYKVNLLMMPPLTRDTAPNAAKLKEAMADARALFDARATFDRLDNLNDFLAQVRTTSDNGNRPPRFNADEYTKIRTERDLIDIQISQLRLAIIGGNEFSSPPAKKKIVEKKGIAIAERSQDFIDQVKADTEPSKERPQYVLVLEARRSKSTLKVAGEQ